METLCEWTILLHILTLQRSWSYQTWIVTESTGHHPLLPRYQGTSIPIARYFSIHSCQLVCNIGFPNRASKWWAYVTLFVHEVISSFSLDHPITLPLIYSLRRHESVYGKTTIACTISISWMITSGEWARKTYGRNISLNIVASAFRGSFARKEGLLTLL